MSGKEAPTGLRKVFLGSSTGAKEHVQDIAAWLERLGVEPIPWDQPQVFLPGSTVMRQLLDIAESEDVVGAALVFAEDDFVSDRRAALPRGNVVLEYGLFAGALGEANTIVLVIGDPELPTDFSGVYVDLNEPNNAKVQLREWVNSLPPRRSSYANHIFPTYVDAAFCTSPTLVARPDILDRITTGRVIPTRYLYDNEVGTDHWVNLCSDLSYSFFHKGLRFWEEEADKIVAAIKAETGNKFDFLSLGPGDGQKDLQLVQAWVRDEDLDVIYYPYDVSIRMIARTVERLRDNRVPVKLRAILADFTSLPLMDSVFMARKAPKVISLLGNSLGNEPDERALIRKLKAHMGEGDLLLLEVRLKGGTDRPSEVCDPEAKRFYFSPLDHYLAIPFNKDKVDPRPQNPPLSKIDNTRSTLVYGTDIVYGGKEFPDAKLICINEYDESDFVSTIEREGFTSVVPPKLSEDKSFLVCLMRSVKRVGVAST